MNQNTPKEIVHWCSAKSVERKVKLIEGQCYDTSTGSRVEVYRIKDDDDFGIRLLNPTVDGKLSLLEFGLSEAAAAALCKGLMHHFQPKIVTKKPSKP